MRLSRNSIAVGAHPFPEKVIQFGAGVLLRGLPDYFIDKANSQGIFQGSIVVVKSTASGDLDSFRQQDNLYIHCIRGIYAGREEAENIINTAISRVLEATGQWQEVLACASDPGLQIVISNTTEVGIELTADDVFASPPSSFPGKLLAFLYQRYQAFGSDGSKGLVIVPTELIPDNGARLQSILIELSRMNGLEPQFVEWLVNANDFCNSLVDRIVPGSPEPSLKHAVEEEIGLTDELMIMSEAYRLWAIETSSDKVTNILSFARADEGVIIAPDITVYRELKVRLLNGTHTICCGLAWLAGFQTVKEAMGTDYFRAFVERVMTMEIAPAIVSEQLTSSAAREFAMSTIDRFNNPAISHRWLSICFQYTAKMMTRNIPVIGAYVNRFGKVPELMSLGFAAYLVFMNRAKDLVSDSHADSVQAAWANGVTNVARLVLGDTALWQTDLNRLPGFTASVQQNVELLMAGEIASLIKNKIK